MEKSDSKFGKHSSWRSVNASITYFEGAIVKQYSKMIPMVALSTTEGELYSAVLTAQDMMFVYHVLLGMELQVQLPMFCTVITREQWNCQTIGWLMEEPSSLTSGEELGTSI